MLQGLHTATVAGTAVNPRAVIDAKGTVELLAASQNPVIETARNREHVLRESHASLKFGLQPGVGILIQQQLDGLGQQLGGIGQQLAQLHAMNTNTRIMSHNRRYATDPIRPLVKSTAGDGHQAALMIHGPPALPQAAQNYQPNAQIGQVPNPWNPNLDSLQHLEILQLVIFYNDNFGIIVGDQVGTRRQKVRNWLVDQA